MDEINILVESYRKLIDGLILTLPKILVGGLLLLLGWLLARLFSRLVTRSLKALRFDKLMDRVHLSDQLKSLKIERTPSEILGKLFYWVFMLLILVGFAEAMELTLISEKIGVLINYIPNLILAGFILVVGLYLAGRMKTFVQASLASHAIGASRMISNILFYLVATFVFLTVLEQLQFDIGLLTSNVMILVGGVALAFALGYGLSAKEIFPNIISSYYNKGMFKVGDRIKIGDAEGEIIELSNISVVIKTADGKRFIPSKKFVTEEVEVIQPS